jgi:hypothetical protein
VGADSQRAGGGATLRLAFARAPDAVHCAA